MKRYLYQRKGLTEQEAVELLHEMQLLAPQDLAKMDDCLANRALPSIQLAQKVALVSLLVQPAPTLSLH